MNIRSAMPGKSETLTVSTTVQVLSKSKYQTAPESMIGAISALITIEDGDIRYTVDGTDPDNGTKHGHVWFAGTPLTLEGQSLIKNFKAIRAGANDASIFVSYF
jgi:hypothetical protein